jgi:hypothetical protein
MSRAIDAIVTGFAKSRPLTEQSLAPLRMLRRDGVLRRIICVTWNNSEIDEYAAWIERMVDVSLVRIPQPDVSGTPNRRGIAYQIETLRAGLESLSEDADLVLKSRPDFIFDPNFLKGKIESFETWSKVPVPLAFGIKMPKAALQNKIWIPWADSNQPFYFEDAAFLGSRRDVQKLVTALSGKDVEILGDETCGSFVHVVRYARIFLASYPLFSRYLAEYRYFVNDMDYRRKLVPHILNDGFFWHALVAHAWILHSQFHVDAGNENELRFYSNRLNPNADWSKLESLKLANPYDDLGVWRAGTRPGHAMPSVLRLYGRLVDDEWQQAIFSKPLPDFPRGTLINILENIAAGDDGRLKEIEYDFYQKLAKFYRENWLAIQR